MPQIIEVPGYGEVEFPDGMPDDQIAAAIRANMAPSLRRFNLPLLPAAPLGGGEAAGWAYGDGRRWTRQRRSRWPLLKAARALRT
jgi:hypothetical protein